MARKQRRRSNKRKVRKQTITPPKLRRPRITKIDRKLEPKSVQKERPQKQKVAFMHKFVHDLIGALPDWLSEAGQRCANDNDLTKAAIYLERLNEWDSAGFFRVGLIAFSRTLSDLIDVSLQTLASDYKKDSDETLKVSQMVFEEVFYELVLKYAFVELVYLHREDLKNDIGDSIVSEMTTLVIASLKRLQELGRKKDGKNIRTKLDK